MDKKLVVMWLVAAALITGFKAILDSDYDNYKNASIEEAEEQEATKDPTIINHCYTRENAFEECVEDGEEWENDKKWIFVRKVVAEGKASYRIKQFSVTCDGQIEEMGYDVITKESAESLLFKDVSCEEYTTEEQDEKP
jgi:hypothetical protein